MVVQIISYETANPPSADFGGVMSEMKNFYLDNGCKEYSLFRDGKDQTCFFEIAYFDSLEAADKFDKLNNAQKNELYQRFCKASNVIGETVEVKILEKI